MLIFLLNSSHLYSPLSKRRKTFIIVTTLLSLSRTRTQTIMKNGKTFSIHSTLIRYTINSMICMCIPYRKAQAAKKVILNRIKAFDCDNENHSSKVRISKGIRMQERSYTLADVASHNGKNGSRVWIIIKGVVYDVTDFLNQHPGGGELIAEYAGKDATKPFNQAGHSSDASKELKKYRIGIVAEKSLVEEKDYNQSISDSQATLNSIKSDKRRRIKFLFCV